MKKFILSFTLLCSCSQTQIKQETPKHFLYEKGKEYIGTWFGQVLVVNVEMTFTESQYQFRTISSNDIWFSGNRGEFYPTSENVILAKQIDSYYYNMDTGSGEWKPNIKYISYEWHVDKEQNAIVFSPNGNDFAVVLFRIK